MEKPPEVKVFTVKEGNREMNVIIPQSGDSSYDNYLEEAEKEKTSDDLRKNQRPAPKMSKKDATGAVKEIRKWKQDRESGKRSKYY